MNVRAQGGVSKNEVLFVMSTEEVESQTQSCRYRQRQADMSHCHA